MIIDISGFLHWNLCPSGDLHVFLILRFLVSLPVVGEETEPSCNSAAIPEEVW
jgi:hypothetical protein